MKIFKRHVYIIGKSPQLDWQRVFISAAVFAVGISIYGFFFYNQIASQSIDSEAPITLSETLANKDPKAQSATSTPPGGGKLDLNQVLDLYQQKKARYNELYNSFKNS
ncbi:MAG: hypothetical protein WCG97_03790 [bacterium]